MGSYATQKLSASASRNDQRQRVPSGVCPQPGGGRRLRTFKDRDEAWRFFLAVQDEGEPLGYAQLERGTTALRARRDADESKTISAP